MTDISVTERGSFRRCREAWDEGSLARKSLRPIVGAAALELGSTVHHALADWASNPALSLSDLYAHHAYQALTKAQATYLAQVGAPISDSELAPLLDTFELGKAMLSMYQEYWETPVPQDFEVLSPEQTIFIPIPGTKQHCAHCFGNGVLPASAVADAKLMLSGNANINTNTVPCPKCEGLGYTQHRLEATFDGLLRHKVTGAIYILEHKTFGQHPKDEELEHNDQFLAYIWALTKLDIGPVGGIAYDGLWKRDHVPKGRTMADMFKRTLLHRNAAELAQFEQMLAWEAADMTNPNLPIYHNRTPNCMWDCMFYKVCDARARGEDVQWVYDTYYTKREKEA